MRKGMASFADGKKAKPQLFLLYPNETGNPKCARDKWGKWKEKVMKKGTFGVPYPDKIEVKSIGVEKKIYPIWDLKDLKKESKSNAGKVMDKPLCTLPIAFQNGTPLTKDNVAFATKLMLVTFQDACTSECASGKNGVTRYAAYVLNSRAIKEKEDDTYSFKNGKFSLTLKVSDTGVTVKKKSGDIRLKTDVKFKIGAFWTKLGIATKKKDKKLPRKVKMPTAEDTAALKTRKGSHYIPQMKF